jgi:hypothetical protein
MCLAKIHPPRFPSVQLAPLGHEIRELWATHPRAAACAASVAAIFLAVALGRPARVFPGADRATATFTASSTFPIPQVRPGRFHVVATDVVVTPTADVTDATLSEAPEPAQRMAVASADGTSETVFPDPVAAPPSDEEIDRPAVAGSTPDKGKTAPKMSPAKRRHHNLAAQRQASPLTKFNQTMHNLLARIF